MNERHHELGIDVERMRIVGLLHDIGKIRENERFREHAFTGAQILKDEGLEDIGKIVGTHGIAKEIAEDEGAAGDFEPRTLEEELLTYADAHTRHDKIVSFEERFGEVIERRRNNPKYYRNLKKGFKGIGKIVDKIDLMLK